MSKKLLKEAAVRRFMGLAGMDANIVSNAVNEMYTADGEEEEEVHEATDTTTVSEADALEPEEEPADAPDMMPEPDAEMPEEGGPEMEITSEEADVLAGVLEKLLAAKGGDAEEELPEELPEEEPVEDELMETSETTTESTEETLSEVELELSEDEVVQEVARRVAARILKAKKAQKEMNEALGK